MTDLEKTEHTVVHASTSQGSSGSSDTVLHNNSEASAAVTTIQDVGGQKNTKHALDDVIVRALQSIDKGNFGTTDKIFFFKELAYLLKGGVALAEATEVIASSSENYAVKDIATHVLQYLHEGKSFSYALNRLPDYFTEGDYAIIKVGEKSGNLPQVLQSLAEEYIYLHEIRNKYTSALMYPIILLVIAVSAIIALFVFVLPNIFSIADQFVGLNLPRTTRVLRDFSTFLIDQRQWLLWVIVGIGLLGTVFFSTDTGKKVGFSMVVSMPLIGKMTKYYYLVKRCRYMKLMLSAGMSYVQTFQLLRDVLDNPAYQRMIERVLSYIQKGAPIHEALSYERDIIPANVVALFKVGEQTAHLQETLDSVLAMYDEELNTIINRLAKVIEPVMLVIVGGIIVMIALGVFGLILQIMEGVGL